MAILKFYRVTDCKVCKKKEVKCIYFEEDYEDVYIDMCQECWNKIAKKRPLPNKSCDEGNCCVRQKKGEWHVTHQPTYCIYIHKLFPYYLCRECVVEFVKHIEAQFKKEKFSKWW